jgi:hypothetical protein
MSHKIVTKPLTPKLTWIVAKLLRAPKNGMEIHAIGFTNVIETTSIASSTLIRLLVFVS